MRVHPAQRVAIDCELGLPSVDDPTVNDLVRVLHGDVGQREASARRSDRRIDPLALIRRPLHPGDRLPHHGEHIGACTSH